MASCSLCKNLQQMDSLVGVAFNFTPDELRSSATGIEKPCSICAVIMEAIMRMGDGKWDFMTDITHIYAYGNSSNHESLSLEVYFQDKRPKAVLELFYAANSDNQDHGAGAGAGVGHGRLQLILPRPSISGHPLSSQGHLWLTTKLNTCLASHKSCRRMDRYFSPKRVLALDKCTFGKITLRLQKTSSWKNKSILPRSLPKKAPQPNDSSLRHTLSPAPLRYAALSHCWGKHQTCITTKQNLPQRSAGIPWLDMPKTFQDAIAFCLEFNIYYLWIDALCIIQDDIADWETEAARMADIYENAFITLAATNSASESDGCFEQPPNTSVREFALKTRPFPEAQVMCDTIMVREKLNHWTTMDGTAKFKQLFPLLTRGWVLQERTLSPRLLYFCQGELVWECREDIRCECGSFNEARGVDRFDGILQNRRPSPRAASRIGSTARENARVLIDQLYKMPPLLQNDTIILHPKTKMSRPPWRRLGTSRPPPRAERPGQNFLHSFFRKPLTYEWHRYSWPKVVSHEQENLYSISNSQPENAKEWHKIVQEYSALELTKESDLLPALSGLASRVSLQLGQYYAGLWQSTFLYDLQWRVNTLRTTSGRPLQFRGPTWSWASVRDPVSYWNALGVSIMASLEIYVHDIEHRDNNIESRWGGRLAPRSHMCRMFAFWDLQLCGYNRFGEISSASIVVLGYIQPARVRYVYNVVSGGVGVGSDGRKRELDPFKYEIEFQTNTHLLAKPGGFIYQQSFFADYMLCLDGPDCIDDGKEVYKLIVHPYAALVLDRLHEGSDTSPPVFRRIGIVEQPESLTRGYGGAINWMAGAFWLELVIV